MVKPEAVPESGELMDTVQLVAFLWVALLWTAAGAAIARWGPGRAAHRLSCPEKNDAAEIVVLHTEAGYGEVRAADVVWCSLFGPAPVSCDKACLAKCGS
jgi:hypothetical protein